MKKVGTVCAVALIGVFLAARTEAQSDVWPQLLARTQSKHASAIENLERILREHPEFWLELQAVAARIETRPEWLLNVMASESLFVAGARNRLPGQTASGLLQIIEDTAQGLGTTTAAIRQMSPVEQLRLVEKYFAPFRGRLKSLADVYTATFRGFIIEGGEKTVVAPLDDSRKEQRIYSLNQWLDLNNDGLITKGEIAAAAFSIGRFGRASVVSAVARLERPNTAVRGGSLYAAASTDGDKRDGKDSSQTDETTQIAPGRQTRSIYVR